MRRHFTRYVQTVMTTGPSEFQPPRTLREAFQQLRFDQPLGYQDPRYVETARARGNFSHDRIVRVLDTLLGDGARRCGNFFLYSGHVGCGKSTELRRLAAQLHGRDRFFVVALDTLERLDTHNLRYPDVLFALAAELLALVIVSSATEAGV